ncbi:hypothetical protein KR222_007824, partial [Zaprionus bogoriensis]
CVEIQPNGINGPNEPYFMCKGADFQPVQSQPEYSYTPTPFPSFPSFGAGFFPVDAPSAAGAAAAPKLAPASTTPSAFPGPNETFAPAPAAQPYGLPAVSYPAAGSPPATAPGAPTSPGAAATPLAYADAAPKKAAPQANNPYEGLMGSRHRSDLDPAVLAVPQVDFQPEELQQQYRQSTVASREPMVGAAPQQQRQHLYQDDPIMRIFYSSLEPSEPQVAQASPVEQPVAAPAYTVEPAAPPPPPTPAQFPPADGNACNSCARPCAAPLETCPSFQPVIIAMPCYGQQQPTHYLAMPAPAAAPAAPPARDPMQSSPFGMGYGMSQQPVGAAFGMAPHQVGASFGMPSPQIGAAFGMQSPQVGAPFGMPSPQVGGPFGMAAPHVGLPFGMTSPQVGAPFGMPPVLNPFGPFGSLNPFNPFNRILGSAAATTSQPKLRLFGAPEEAPTTTTGTTSAPGVSATSSKNFLSSTEATTTGASRSLAADHKEQDDDDVVEDDDDGEGEDEAVGSAADTESPQAVATTVGDSVESKSVEAKGETVDELLTKGEEKLKSEKRKRQNSRYSSNSQKRKYLQRL